MATNNASPDKGKQVQAQVDEVIGIMQNNIEKVCIASWVLCLDGRQS